MEKLNSNIWKLYLIKGLRSFMLTMPIIVLFLQNNGLTVKEVFLLQSLFSVAVIILEVPTGYFSDVFGRKNSIVIGTIMATVGYLVYSRSHGFWGFLSAEVILGVGVSFVSGSDSAMLYDTLFSLNREPEYKKAEGRGMGIALFSESVASVIGGFLALASLRFPFYVDTVITLLGLPVALALVEPEKRLKKVAGSGLKNMTKVLKFSLIEHKEVKWLIIYSALAGASTLTMFWFTQPYLSATRVPQGFFGVILAAYLLSASFFSWNAHRIERKLSKRGSLLLLVVLPALGYLFLSFWWFVWSGVFVLLFYVARGINNPIISDYINGSVSSDVRATILSVKNLMVRLTFAIFGPIAGWISDTFSLKTALLSSGATFLVLGFLALAHLRKHKVL